MAPLEGSLQDHRGGVALRAVGPHVWRGHASEAGEARVEGVAAPRELAKVEVDVDVLGGHSRRTRGPRWERNGER